VSDTHGPVRALVERMYDVTRSYMLAAGADAEALLDEWQRVCDAADALDAGSAREPDYDEVFHVPPLSRHEVTVRVTDKGRGEPVWIDDTPADIQPVTWPQGDEAAEQLAHEIHKAEMKLDDEHAAWEDLTLWWKLRYRKVAAAVLARLAQGVGDAS
jgi:hypothetical protein